MFSLDTVCLARKGLVHKQIRGICEVLPFYGVKQGAGVSEDVEEIGALIYLLVLNVKWCYHCGEEFMGL